MTKVEIPPSLNGDWPALAVQNGKAEAVYRLLLRMKHVGGGEEE